MRTNGGALRRLGGGRGKTRALVAALGVATLAWAVVPAAAAEEPGPLQVRNEDGPHCADRGRASRIGLAVRPKDRVDPAGIVATSSIWAVTKIDSTRNSWVIRMKAGRTTPAATVHVSTPIGSRDVAVPAFDKPCPNTAPDDGGPGGAGGPGGLEASDPEPFSGATDIAAFAGGLAGAQAASSTSRTPEGFLPFTGAGTLNLLPIGALSLFLGILLLLLRGRRARPEALLYDGRLLADA
jgi:hypothetical protein